MIEKIYIGAFTIKDTNGDDLGEVIFSGYKELPNGLMHIRSTIETETKAVPSLIKFCNDIAETKNLKWRLLLASNVEEIDKSIYDDFPTKSSYQ